MHDNRNQNMDSSFYQDESAQYASQSQNTRKRPETLDLNKLPAKKPRFNQSLSTSAVLNSPDVQKLSMATPDIEKFIISHSTLQTPTPSLVFPQTVKVSTEIKYPIRKYFYSFYFELKIVCSHRQQLNRKIMHVALKLH